MISEALRPQGDASRKGNFFYIVPLDPPYKAAFAGHAPATAKGQSMTQKEYVIDPSMKGEGG